MDKVRVSTELEKYEEVPDGNHRAEERFSYGTEKFNKEGINSKLDQVGERISELEDMIVEFTRNRRKENKRN